MISRRNLLFRSVGTAAAAAAAAVNPRRLFAAREDRGIGANTPVVTPNVSSLPWRLEDGRKTFHLVAEPLVREFAPGFKVNCWGAMPPVATSSQVQGADTGAPGRARTA